MTNGVPIASWFDDADDVELRDLLPLLEKLRDVSDVRAPLDRIFKQHAVTRMPPL